MKLVDSYISRSILVATAVVALVISALLLLMLFISEADNLGEGTFGIGKVLVYMALMWPTRIYLVLPVVAMLGSLMALGALAGGSELVVFRSAGVSMRRLAVSVGVAGAIMAGVTVVMGEFMAPVGISQAEALRDTARHGEVKQSVDDGLWLRQEGYILRIDATLPGGRIDGLLVYQFDEQGRLVESIKARKAHLEGRQLMLDKPEITRLSLDHSSTKAQPEMALDIPIDPKILALAVVQPDELSSIGLWQYIGYLDANNINAADYKLALWRNIVTPFTVWVLVIFALPFAFGSLRSASAGQRLFVGGLVGMLFFLNNEIIASTGPVYGVPPWMAASLPTVLLAIGTGWWLRRLS